MNTRGLAMFNRLFSNNRKPVDYSVLLVDDDPAISMSVTDILRDEGYTVHSTTSGDDALTLMDQVGLPDLMIVDLIMPVMNGEQFLDRARVRFGRTALPPILIITGANNGEATANHLMASDFLPKPFSDETLLNHVFGLLEARNKGKQ
jgi:CheY-like chemotaxis protein